jgi:hypothetical protein
MRIRILFVLLAGLWGTAGSASAEDIFTKPLERNAVVEEIRNEQASFVIRVEVDHKDRIYVDRDVLHATVRSQREGYLYLLYANAEGKTKCLFPNYVQADNRIKANEDVQVPGVNAKFRIRIGAPFGREVLKALVAARPLSAKELELGSLTEGAPRSVSEKGVRDACVELNTTPARDWAEHQVELTTVQRRESSEPDKKAARFGVVVGVAKYRDSAIPQLPACRNDAELMASLFKQHCGVSDMTVLVDEKATRANVEKVFRQLAQGTKAGDEILIYWSGHGASVADTDGDEADGMDELLVTHDTTRDDPGKTGLLDDVMRRWVQDLDGRRVVFIIDACMAGGWAGTGKGVVQSRSIFDNSDAAPAAPEKAKAAWKFDFLEGELAQTKDIGQNGTAVLASSTDKEISLVRRDHKASVMTGFLVEFVARANGSVPLKAVAEYVGEEVPKYVRANFPNVNQHPQFSDNMVPSIYLRP